MVLELGMNLVSTVPLCDKMQSELTDGRLVKRLSDEIHGNFIDATSDEIWASLDAAEAVKVPALV